MKDWLASAFMALLLVIAVAVIVALLWWR